MNDSFTNDSTASFAASFVVHQDIRDLASAVAQRIAKLAVLAIKDRGEFSIALAGGETPRLCYEQLRDQAINWKRVHIYFGDERCRPCGDKQRNDVMAYETLLKFIPIPSENIHSISAEKGARIAATEYAAQLKPILPLDLVLLGMGEDGHTASLFPGNPATLQELSVVPVFDAPKVPSERVSLGMESLNTTRNKIFLVAGAGKRESLKMIASGADLPAAQVRGAEWHVDHAAWPGKSI